VPPIKLTGKLNAVDTHVGSRVRSLRLQMKMSQSDLADKLGITFQQIQKYEKGTNRISSSRLHQIAGIFGVSAPYFFEDPLTNASPVEDPLDTVAFDQFCSQPDQPRSTQDRIHDSPAIARTADRVATPVPTIQATITLRTTTTIAGPRAVTRRRRG